MKQNSSISSSEKDRKRGKYKVKCSIFASIAVLMLILAWFSVLGLEKVADDRQDSQKITSYQLSDFYGLEENSLDIIITGSSHAMCSYDPEYIMSETGLDTYNLGTALQQPDTAYYLMKEVYKTQKPKYWICDMYFKTLSPGKDTQQSETVLQEMKLSLNSIEMYLFNLPFDGAMGYLSGRINPFGRLYSITSDWDNAVASKDKPRDPKYRGRGYFLSEAVITEDHLKPENHPFPQEYEQFSQRQLEYLEKTIQLAKDNGTEIIFVTAPIPPTILGRISYYKDINADVNKIAEKYGIRFIDFGMDQLSGGLDMKDEEFADQGHMNPQGAEVFMPYFVQKIEPLLNVL